MCYAVPVSWWPNFSLMLRARIQAWFRELLDVDVMAPLQGVLDWQSSVLPDSRTRRRLIFLNPF
jgi:hypothetical protein